MRLDKIQLRECKTLFQLVDYDLEATSIGRIKKRDKQQEKSSFPNCKENLAKQQARLL